MNHERRGQIAGARDDRGTRLKRHLQTALFEESGAGLGVEADSGGSGRLEMLVCGAEDSVDGKEGKVIHDHTDHAGLASRARRYISRASSGRFSRSSIRPAS